MGNLTAFDIASTISLLVRSAGVLAVIAAAIAGLSWLAASGKTGTRQPSRGANSHVNADGKPKKAFDTAQEASQLAQMLHDKDGADMAVYRCTTCQKFHVGRSKRR